MPCLLGLIGFFAPRLVLVILWLAGYTQTAFQTALWPLLGFFFMPFATLAYAYGMNTNGSISGLYLVLVIIGALLDFGTLGSGGRHARQRRIRVQR